MKTKTFFTLLLAMTCYLSKAQEDTVLTASKLFELSLEQLMNIKVTTASKREESITETPNVMHVVTQQQIKARGYRNLRDVLSDIPGFNILHKDLQYVSQVRGIAPNDNEKVSLMINGVIISQVTEDNYLTDLINLDNISKIEVIIGPGSVLYGAKSLCAIINLITKESNETAITLGAGNYKHIAATVSSGKQYEDGKSFFVSATGVKNDGWDAWRNSSEAFKNLRGTSLTGKLYPSYFIFGKATFNNWSMQFTSFNSSMPELYIHNSNTRVEGNRDDEIDNMTVSNNKKWTSKISTVIQGIYTNKRLLRATTFNDTIKGVQTSFDLAQKEYAINPSFIYQTEKHYFQTGIQANYFQNRHNYTFDWRPNNPADTLTYMNSIVDIKDTYALGFYVSDNYNLSKKFKITAAFRVDRNTILENKKFYFSPRAALIYTPSKHITAKLLYNTATRMPTPWMSPLNEVWNVNKYNNLVRNPWLLNHMAEKPEILTAYELQTIFNFKSTVVSVNFYYQTLVDFTAWFSPFTNVGDFNGTGGEMNIVSEINKSVKIWGNASYNKAAFTNKSQSGPDLGAGKVIANEQGEMMSVPLVTANLGFDLNYGKFNFSPRIKYLYHSPAFDAPSGTYFYIEHRAYLNATLSMTNIFNKNLTLQLIGKNLTNNTQILPMQFQQLTYNPQGTNFEVVASFAF